MAIEPAVPDTAVARAGKVTSLDVGLFLIRVLPGIVFLFHGSQKLFAWFGGPGLGTFGEFLAARGVPAPLLAATLATLAEFVGGLSLLTGIGLRLMAIPLFVTMMVACFLVHPQAFSGEHDGME
ncbi:MAG TPA: DoxX family protein [Phycisphaerae bacterium]|jgi:putative oxidoreductase|nr:DoxX family protein [Phycisphaerae bacterium]HPC23156.1 DoxX family protein [Phycisphaerae bacterium]HRS29096.1 DoxX family protein [Phycisphaerae bacterium]HRT42742.1 DoxX family protein [Phycisphaerae bacterium]